MHARRLWRLWRMWRDISNANTTCAPPTPSALHVNTNPTQLTPHYTTQQCHPTPYKPVNTMPPLQTPHYTTLHHTTPQCHPLQTQVGVTAVCFDGTPRTCPRTQTRCRTKRSKRTGPCWKWGVAWRSTTRACSESRYSPTTGKRSSFARRKRANNPCTAGLSATWSTPVTRRYVF